MRRYWTVQEEWKGETVFMVGGGPSLRGVSLDCLRGRRVVAINSSYLKVPFADLLFFGDARWFLEHREGLDIAAFKGRIASCSSSVSHPRVLNLNRVVPPPGYAEARDAVASQRTSLQGAMNLVGHLGARKIVLVGIDMGRAPDGVSHHHAPHPWPPRPGNVVWDEQMHMLESIVEPLKRHKIEVVNTSPVSRIPWWPKQSLQDVLAMESDDVGRQHAS